MTKKFLVRRQEFFIWTKTLLLPTENIFSYLDKYYVTTAVFLPGKKRFRRRQKNPSSTSSVLLGRKQCLCQQKTFCLTGKKFFVTKPFCRAKKMQFDDKSFIWTKTMFVPTEHILLTGKNYSVTKPFFSGEKKYLSTTKKFLVRRQEFFIWTKTLLLPTENILSYWHKYYVTTADFSTWKKRFCRRQIIPLSTTSVLLERKPLEADAISRA